MQDSNISQEEATYLLELEKHKIDETEWEVPILGNSISIPLKSLDGREDFFLDMSQSNINLKRGKYQNRARKTIILIRLDFNGPPHRNPDDEEIPSPHLHYYVEGYNDKWAMAVPKDNFSDINNLWKTLEEFMKYCNITEPPLIRKTLFI